MRIVHLYFVLALLLSSILLAQNAYAEDAVEAEKVKVAAATIINQHNEVIGKAIFRQLKKGVEIELIVHSLTAGEHGIHLHENGTCRDLDSFKASGGHIMHDSHPHGLNHPEGPDAGDLKNLVVDEDGTASYRYVNKRVSLNGEGEKPSLLDENGSALIIHADADDQLTQPIGGAGARVACGKINPLLP